MVHYIIQVAAFQMAFLLIYDLFLKKETFFNWNRLYLLVTAVLSLIIPFIKIGVFKDVMPKEYVLQLPAVVIGNVENTNQVSSTLDTVTGQSQSIWTLENLLYAGMVFMALLFAFKLFKVVRLLWNNPKTKFGDLHIVNVLRSNAAFSFFRYVFLGEQLKEDEKNTILAHEKVHVEENHTFDLLFFEVLRILFWFNPFVYMYQNRITVLHEFIADQHAIKQHGKTQYYQNLLSQVFATQNISFINPFFKQSLIKKRIVMLQKSKSKQINLLKYALLLPIVVGMLVYTSCDKEKEADALDLEQYTYTSKHSNSETKKAREKYEAFLMANNGKYVGWTQGDGTGGIIYSVHSMDEKVPDNLTKSSFYSKNGLSYKVYFDPTILPPPPPPPPAPEELLEMQQKTASEKDYVEIEEGQPVPFAIVENVPIFPGCEGLTSNEERKKCISENITKVVSQNFNKDLATDLGLTGVIRTNVMFKINTEGNIEGIQSRSSHPAMAEEAIRVVKMFPKMIPGEQRGKKVTVQYVLPIIFQVVD
ncbi:M56 family metallopeptidase [Flavobacteriaceae bacterium XHP0103]|uniref:M56 family metallopeptidase n=1 Tax=Marixanthotalea marina TaxID=2844359 RepID=UPI002989E313|nr:M56 family metallopeptidase [Marixanthotalea marina]MBU3822007.1 M56 family metallopeptidase [Marixanthotalea marina]